jgi:hypothetical protein
MAIEQLSKKEENDVIDAITSAIRLSNDGVEPSEAIAKVASDRGYNRHFAQRMVEAFNVSKTLKHHKESSGEGRAAPFSLADSTKVLDIMFPDKVDTPLEKAASTWTPPECSHRETRFFNLSSAPRKSEREAEHSWESQDPDILMKRAFDELGRRERRVEIARHAMETVKMAAIDAANAFANYFRSLGHEPFERVEKAALQHYGDQVKPLLDAAWTISSAGKFGEKRAEGPGKIVYQHRRPYVLLKDAMDKRGAYIEKAAEYKTAAADAGEYSRRLGIRARLMGKWGQASMPSLLSGALAGQAASQLARRPSMYEALVRATEELEDPDIEAERKAIQAKLLLRNLMRRDEVLSRADPNEVVAAFNELSNLVPRAIESPMALRALLRKRVEQGQLDPLELTNIMSIEKTMREAEQVPSVLGPGGQAIAAKPEESLQKLLTTRYTPPEPFKEIVPV